MLKNKFVFSLTIFIIHISFSNTEKVLSKDLIKVNDELFNKIISPKKIGEKIENSYNKLLSRKIKWLLIFYADNCLFCDKIIDRLNTDKTLVKKIRQENKVNIGLINLDLFENIWINIRLNITRIPYILLIDNDTEINNRPHIYEYQTYFDEYQIINFINDDKNINDSIKIPDDVSTMNKILILLNYVVNSITYYFENKLGNVFNWDKNLTIILLILLLIISFYIIKLFICLLFKLLCKICCKKKPKLKNNKITEIKEKEENENTDTDGNLSCEEISGEIVQKIDDDNSLGTSSFDEKSNSKNNIISSDIKEMNYKSNDKSSGLSDSSYKEMADENRKKK